MGPEQFRRLEHIVEVAMRARRSLWDIVCRRPREVTAQRLSLSDEEAQAWRAALGPELAASEDDPLLGREVSVRFLESHALVRELLSRTAERDGRTWPELRLAADLAFLVWRNVKQHHPIAGAGETQLVFSQLCDVLAQCASAGDGTESRPKPIDVSRPELRDRLRNAAVAFLGAMPSRPARADTMLLAAQYLELFFEVCFSLEDLDRGGVAAGAALRPEWLDPSFLLSRLFGMRTGILGFDVLFEGGINLAAPWAASVASGRTVLIRGQFNAGKSILALSLAAELARKGGSATVVALEDTLDVLKSYVSSFNLADEPATARVAQVEGDRDQADEGVATDGTATQGTIPGLLSVRTGGGEISLLHYPNASDGLGRLLSTIKKHFADESTAGAKSGLKRPQLLVIDPVNSLTVANAAEHATLRADLMHTLEEVRNHNANLVLVAESTEPNAPEARSAGDWTDILPYVADVVIDLSNDRRHGYDQRYIQVSKSRFQRERRGRHPLSITPGRGMVIAPSSAALRSELAFPRWADDTRAEISFGFPDVDRLLPEGAFRRGDIIVLRGPQGSFKTLLGLHFLAADRPSPPQSELKPKSLLLTDRTDIPLGSYVNADGRFPPDLAERITIAPLQRGYVQPGRLLRDLRARFAAARARGVVYDRVLIAAVGRWDLNCPFVRDDPAFGNTLLDLLRWEGASAVFVCGDRSAEKESVLQRSVVDRATAVFDFERIEFQGGQRALMRIIRARAAPRSRDWYELSLQRGGLQVDRSLLRIVETGEGLPPRAETVKTTLAFFQLGQVQQKYHEEVQARLRAVLTTDVTLTDAVLQEAARLGPLSVGSHLQLVQIDEFQLPALKYSSDGRSMLHPFSVDVRRPWEADPGICAAMTRREPSGRDAAEAVVAVPYYSNVALLALSREWFKSRPVPQDWETIAREAETWESARKADARPPSPDLPATYFSFAKRPEDYNCIFLEIALSLRTPETLQLFTSERHDDDPAGFDLLLGWLNSQSFKDALTLFHRVCAAGHRQDHKEQGPLPCSGIVTRLWFTALRFWTDSDRSQAERITIAPLPGRVGISGEWYLGVWAHSAVPEIGLKIIERLTQRDEQLERLRRGIGLPVERDLFVADPLQYFPHVRTSESQIGELVQSAHRRSRLFKYHLLSPILSEHLTSFLNLPFDAELAARTVNRLVKNVTAVVKPNGSGRAR